MPRSLITFALVGSLSIAGCAPNTVATASNPSTATSHPLDLTAWQPPAGQQCEILRPDSLPAFGAVFDSLALGSTLRGRGGSGAVLVSVAADSLGFPSAFHRIETTLPAADADLLEDSLRVHFRGASASARASASRWMAVGSPASCSERRRRASRCSETDR